MIWSCSYSVGKILKAEDLEPMTFRVAAKVDPERSLPDLFLSSCCIASMIPALRQILESCANEQRLFIELFLKLPLLSFS